MSPHPSQEQAQLDERESAPIIETKEEFFGVEVNTTVLPNSMEFASAYPIRHVTHNKKSGVLGVKNLHISDQRDGVYQMGAGLLTSFIQRNGPEALQGLDLISIATSSPDTYLFEAIENYIGRHTRVGRTHAACNGIAASLEAVHAARRRGLYFGRGASLFIGTDAAFWETDPDRSIEDAVYSPSVFKSNPPVERSIFGDGAGSIYIPNPDQFRIVHARQRRWKDSQDSLSMRQQMVGDQLRRVLGSDYQHDDYLRDLDRLIVAFWAPTAESGIQMPDGRTVESELKAKTRPMVQEILHATSIDLTNLVVVPHQASQVMLRRFWNKMPETNIQINVRNETGQLSTVTLDGASTGKYLKERTVVDMEDGNIIAGTIPSALQRAISGNFRNMKVILANGGKVPVLMIGMGAGYGSTAVLGEIDGSVGPEIIPDPTMQNI